ncbi:hypothetical protein F4819DRAFT_70708 [Hypoxylon fuscum]|nr:hypothetical protein F4819DRAFT_70708 [Hypoxylon fuscum]
MAPFLNPRSDLRARGGQLSSGAIAGTVIGCVFGGSFLLIVLGFLYFRHRRMSRQAIAGEILPTTKEPGTQRRTFFHIPGFPHRQAPTAQADRPPSAKEEIDSRGVQGLSDGPETQHGQVPGYEDDYNHDPYFTHQNFGQPPLPPGIDFSLPPQPTAFPTSEPGPDLPSNHATSGEAANSSYYDTRISMDSDPDRVPEPMSRQMTELYEAQLKDSREHRRSGSLKSRIWSSIKRKRSTHSSTHGTSSPHYSASNQYFPTSPVTSPVSIKQEPLSQKAEGKASASRFFEEPGEMSEDAGVSSTSIGGSWLGKDQQQHKRQRRGDFQRSDSQFDAFPLRTSSSILETTERDPELPSAVLRKPDSTDRLPHSAQPQSETRPSERLKSPDIPEPMELSETPDGIHTSSVIQGSRSPQLQPESFVSPMSIMQPSNTMEKVAYTNYQMENSTSPPTFPVSPPEIVTDQPSHENFENPNQDHQDDFDADSFLDIPSDDEPRRSGDSYDYATTTTPGQSSTDPSMGRTPDTRITVSPSPFSTANEQVKMEVEPSSSPEASRISPQSPGYICEECGRYFDQVHKLNHHKRYHDRKHECPYEGCDKKFGTKTHLDRHINDKHVKSKAYHCTEPTCQYFKGGKAFPRKDNWRRHMVKKHGATPDQLEAMDESVG